MSAPLVLPRPQRLEERSDHLTLDGVLHLAEPVAVDSIEPALTRLEAALATGHVSLRRDSAVSDHPRLRLEHEAASARHPEAYDLRVDSSGIVLRAARDVGFSHALSTLTQWTRARLEIAPSDGARLPGVEVRDYPDLDARGVLLDISRSRVPTMETLFWLVDLMAEWKLNQLELYMEHTFAYRGHEIVWRDASPMTPDEIRTLDAYCHRRHIELVPNQNSCGHLHRWLVHEPYRRLAECPQGIEHPFSSEREPFGLCTTDPAALALLEDLYDQLLPCFSSSMFHVGLDETLDLGRCRSRREAERLGVAELYRQFLCEVHRLLADRDRRMQFWGDIVAAHPEILPNIPSDAIVMEWGYEAEHDFDARAERLSATGLDFYLCPGTSSWLSFAGRLEAARRNVAAAACAAARHGATGLLVTDWGDQGHLQPLPSSLPGVLMAAGFSWNVGEAARPEAMPVADLLATHAFFDLASSPTASAQGLVTLADLYRQTGGRSFNASPLFYLLLRPDLPLDDRRLAGLEPGNLERCLHVAERVSGTGPAAGGRTQIEREIAWIRDALAAGAAAGLARLAGRLDGNADLIARLDSLIARHGDLWLARSRPGGRAESRAHLERARRLFAAGG